MANKETGLGTRLEPLQIRSVLCPVDFSEFSNRAFGYAVSLATRFDSSLFLQHTVERAQYLLEGIGPGVTKMSPATQLHNARESIRQMLSASGADASRITVLLNQGDVSTRILETIVKESIDLVVMGTHGRKGFNRFLLGSVSEGIVHQAACPVLAVSLSQKEMTTATAGQLQLRTILLATDFSPHSDIAAAYAMKWASEWGARLIVLHVADEASSSMRGMVHLLPEYDPRFRRQTEASRKRIERLIPEKVAHDSEVSFDVRHGNPKEEILRVARETNADLIVTGARGMNGSNAPWGSVSAAVVRDGRFPVLVACER